MSAQFGMLRFDGAPIDCEQWENTRTLLASYGPDGESVYQSDGLGLIVRAFSTTAESGAEEQPLVSPSGRVYVWDGRLDNRIELMNRLAGLSTLASDAAIVASAFEQFGHKVLPLLIGDWSLSIWDPRDRTVLLATDCIGVRPLYYAITATQVTWCTVLEPLVRITPGTIQLCEEYIAGWISSSPEAGLTPYANIRSVPASSWVTLRAGKTESGFHWSFDPTKLVRYQRDDEYEEHFRVLFRQSVRRRLRSFAPVLAELSGGMDSSSIVCVADDILDSGEALCPRLDTVSYFDDSEPNWNERPFAALVEKRRGHVGHHLDLAVRHGNAIRNMTRSPLAPGEVRWEDPITRSFRDRMVSQNNLVLLSGFGGDEVMGGVPTPLPELADLLVTGQLVRFLFRLQAWAVVRRVTVWKLAVQVGMSFLPTASSTLSKTAPEWLDRAFAIRNHKAFGEHETRFRLIGSGLPSFQAYLGAISLLRRHLGCTPPPVAPIHEVRYPYLDRDLLEFLLAIPQSQRLRPGQRRSLHRRALAGIVPDEIVFRKRKAYASHGPRKVLLQMLSALLEEDDGLVAEALGIINGPAIHDSVRRLATCGDGLLFPLMRATSLEVWLRALKDEGKLQLPQPRNMPRSPALHSISQLSKS